MSNEIKFDQRRGLINRSRDKDGSPVHHARIGDVAIRQIESFERAARRIESR